MISSSDLIERLKGKVSIVVVCGYCGLHEVFNLTDNRIPEKVPALPPGWSAPGGGLDVTCSNCSIAIRWSGAEGDDARICHIFNTPHLGDFYFIAVKDGDGWAIYENGIYSFVSFNWSGIDDVIRGILRKKIAMAEIVVGKNDKK